MGPHSSLLFEKSVQVFNGSLLFENMGPRSSLLFENIEHKKSYKC